MADYIDSNILCQAYLHIDHVDFNNERLEQLREELELFLRTRGRFFIYDNVETSVEFKDGSIKVYLGIAGAIYLAITQYGSFRSGIDYLAADTIRLAECIVSETLFLSRSRHDNIIRVEARNGVVGSLKSALDKIELIRTEINVVPTKQTESRLRTLEEDVDRLLGNLKDDNDIAYVSTELCKFIKQMLPGSPPKDPKKPHPPDFIVIYQTRRKNLIDLVTRIRDGQHKPQARKARKARKRKK